MVIHWWALSTPTHKKNRQITTVNRLKPVLVRMIRYCFISLHFLISSNFSLVGAQFEIKSQNFQDFNICMCHYYVWYKKSDRIILIVMTQPTCLVMAPVVIAQLACLVLAPAVMAWLACLVMSQFETAQPACLVMAPIVIAQPSCLVMTSVVTVWPACFVMAPVVMALVMTVKSYLQHSLWALFFCGTLIILHKSRKFD